MAAMLCVVPLAMPPATAQSTSGSILGDVADLSGAFLPGATVSVSNNATGATREALTNETGAFRFSGLPPSSYSVTVEFPGFGTVTRPSVMLAVGGTTKVDFELDVGPITESITVTGAVPLVQPTENTVQVVVANQRVQELPSKSRDFMDLMLLSPGVTVDQSSARSGN
ncbi:MAG: carboxypeptidase regulatory-like domain-containing protein, partial [Acidobacteriia bacterium]|nr:carboxypeptidase regulatory-like domain-containing protein [Terriglobia bacterium]